MAINATVHISLIIYLLCTIIIGAMLSKLTIAFCQQKSSSNDPEAQDTQPIKASKVFSHRLLIICNIAGIVCFLLFSIGIVIVLIALIIHGNDTTVIYETITRALFFFYILGLWIMLYIFVARIDYTFSDSYLAYSPRVIHALYAWVIILGILFSSAIGMYAHNSRAVQRHWVWIVALCIIAHFTFCVTLIWLLCKKVYIAMQRRIEQRLSHIVASKSNSEENTDQYNNAADIASKEPVLEINTIRNYTRYTFLITTGIISTYIGTLVTNYAMELESDPEYDGERLIILAIDTLVNAFALYFLFGFATTTYDKYCQLCHRGCEGCFIQCLFTCLKNDDLKTKKQTQDLILR